jgi:microsomal dipeptidase-like Zn-dependent dipeptidase
MACLALLTAHAQAQAAPAGLANPGFESGLAGWTKSGNAFDAQPTDGENVAGSRVGPVSVGGDYWRDIPFPIGVRGRYWIGTNEACSNAAMGCRGAVQGDAPRGALQSAHFTIPAETKFISFLIGGGQDAKLLRVELLEASGGRAAVAAGTTPKTGHNSDVLRRDWWDVTGLDRQATYLIRIVDDSAVPGGHINVDDIRFEPGDPRSGVLAPGRPALLQTFINGQQVWTDYDTRLWGAADLHTHPMSHLSMGGKLMHGTPDIGSLMPPGMQKVGSGCNAQPVRTTSAAQALGDCSATHGGWGLDNTCGDHIRAFAINVAFDDGFVHRYPFIPTDSKCGTDLVEDAGLCYEKCRSGFHGAGPMCHKNCPSGFADHGLHCGKPQAYGRGAGYALNFGEFNLDGAMARCRRDHSQGCEQNGLIIYPKCRSGFHAVGCCICSPNCPSGMTDIGVSCQKNGSYGRGAGTVPVHNFHGDHPHAGYPLFAHWPHWSTKSHQQMYVDWLKRAHQGGLRVIVALAVNNELLGQVVNGGPPRDDKAATDVQVDEIRQFVGRHADFMREVQTAAEFRKAIKDGKLAVIVGVEVDNIGNFNYGNPNLQADPQAIRAEIQRLYQRGVRYIFPIHFADNVFGGAAVKGGIFNLANQFARTRPLATGMPYPPGFLYKVKTATDPAINFRLTLLGDDWGHSLTLATAKLAIDGLGQVPFPPAFDAGKCPIPVLGCVPQFRLMSSLMTPDPQWDMYRGVAGGHANERGLTDNGVFAIKEMMRLGMIIDIDHMSDRAANQALEIARVNKYPVNSGHTGFRAQPGQELVDENSRTAAQLTVLGNLGGMMGVGWGHRSHSGTYLVNFRYGRAQRLVAGQNAPAFAMGSDINGFVETPRPRHNVKLQADPGASAQRPSGITVAAWNTRVQYGTGALLQYRSETGRAWDYNTEGVAHIGLYPDLFQDLKNLGMTADERIEFFNAADAFARMWDQIETSRAAIR